MWALAMTRADRMQRMELELAQAREMIAEQRRAADEARCRCFFLYLPCHMSALSRRVRAAP